MKEYLFQAVVGVLLTVSVSVTGWLGSTTYDLATGVSAMNERINSVNITAISAAEIAESASMRVELHEELPYHAGVPSLIQQTLEVNQTMSELSELRSARIRLRRIVEGDGIAPPVPQDISDYDEILEGIEEACDSLALRDVEHRECR